MGRIRSRASAVLLETPRGRPSFLGRDSRPGPLSDRRRRSSCHQPGATPAPLNASIRASLRFDATARSPTMTSERRQPGQVIPGISTSTRTGGIRARTISVVTATGPTAMPSRDDSHAGQTSFDRTSPWRRGPVKARCRAAMKSGPKSAIREPPALAGLAIGQVRQGDADVARPADDRAEAADGILSHACRSDAIRRPTLHRAAAGSTDERGPTSPPRPARSAARSVRLRGRPGGGRPRPGRCPSGSRRAGCWPRTRR